jgi:hypothetical protein
VPLEVTNRMAVCCIEIPKRTQSWLFRGAASILAQVKEKTGKTLNQDSNHESVAFQISVRRRLSRSASLQMFLSALERCFSCRQSADHLRCFLLFTYKHEVDGR